MFFYLVAQDKTERKIPPCLVILNLKYIEINAFFECHRQTKPDERFACRR